MDLYVLGNRNKSGSSCLEPQGSPYFTRKGTDRMQTKSGNTHSKHTPTLQNMHWVFHETGVISFVRNVCLAEQLNMDYHVSKYIRFDLVTSTVSVLQCCQIPFIFSIYLWNTQRLQRQWPLLLHKQVSNVNLTFSKLIFCDLPLSHPLNVQDDYGLDLAQSFNE